MSVKKDIDTKKSFLQKFGLLFFDRSKTTFAVWAALVVFGLLSYGIFMQRQGFPNVEVPISLTTGTYFVNDKTKVDTEIVKPLADLATRQKDVKKVTSTAGDNFFSMAVEYKEGTDTRAALKELEAAISVAHFLPESAKLSSSTINASKFNNKYDVLLAVYQPGVTSTEQLVADANTIAISLKGTDGISSVDVIDPYKTGISPTTGQPVSLRQTFDRVVYGRAGRSVFIHQLLSALF